MHVVDGARGEGGGQVARVALALSAATGEPVTVENVRANRPQPGLKAGHVAACLALAELTRGRVEGATIGSTRVAFTPGPLSAGEYAFNIGTAGPVTLLLQAVMPALLASRQPFSLRLTGGTNVAWAPQWDDFVHVHAPLLRMIGMDVEPVLVRRGFFPQGGGEVEVNVETPALHAVDLTAPGPLRRVAAVVPSHGLPRHIMERASLTLHELLDPVRPVEIETDFHRGPGTGMAVSVRAECASTVLGADAVGRKGVRVEDVVEKAAMALRAELDASVGVDIHQADQLPVLLALGAGGKFTCRHLTPHARTVMELLPEFLPVQVSTKSESEGRRVRVEVTRRH